MLNNTRAALLLLVALAGCSSNHPMKTVGYVDLKRFMGDWYVIANIPTFIEEDAYNAVESYRLNADGTVATTFTFRQGSFDGELKRYEPTGFIRDPQSNALWGMQFLWPIKADYRIVYLDQDYTRTIIGRRARDYVWIMARTPSIPEPTLQALEGFVRELGYDVTELRRVPQYWPVEQRSVP